MVLAGEVPLFGSLTREYHSLVLPKEYHSLVKKEKRVPLFGLPKGSKAASPGPTKRVLPLFGPTTRMPDLSE